MKIEGIIFDLDQTLVDTKSVLKYREDRNWGKAIRNLYQTKVFPDVKEMLLNLSEKHIKYGVVTSSPRKYAEAVISHHNLCIQVLVAYQDTGKHKPLPDPILKGIKELGLNNKNVLTVGDVELDIIAGKSAGAITALCGWAKNDNDCKVLPDFIFNKPSELFKDNYFNLNSIQTGVSI